MEEKKIPDLQEFYSEVLNETRSDIFRQRLIVAKKIFELPPSAMKEIHLEEWYNYFWNLCGISLNVKNLSPDEENLFKNIPTAIEDESDPIRRQYLVLILILLGKFDDAKNFIDLKFWTKRLKDDFVTFEKWKNLVTSGPDLPNRAVIRRTRTIKNFLTEKYSDVIKKYSGAVIDNKTCPKVAPKDFQIYYCWLQGEEYLTPVARICYNVLKKQAGNYKIIFLDENNFSDYVDIPDYIVQKFKSGKMKPAHFSDVIRVNLLEKFGGLWLDATILVTDPLENHKKFWKLNYFTQKFINERDNDFYITKHFKAYSSYGRWATFVQSSGILHNPLFAFEKDFYNEYWRDYDEAIDYVIMDIMTDIACDNIPAVKKEIDDVPINNPDVWTLNGRTGLLAKDFNFDAILKNTFLHKMTSRTKLYLDTPGTLSELILNRYAPELIGKL